MSYENQLLNIYLSNLTDICSKNQDDPTDPTIYNALFHIHKYYSHINNVPNEHLALLQEPFQKLLKDEYNDYVTDNGEIHFKDFLNIWGNTNLRDAYESNGSYCMYTLTINTLKKIYMLIKNRS